MTSNSIKLHYPNGSEVDNTRFDRFETIEKSAKVIKYHSEKHFIKKKSLFKDAGLGSVILLGWHA